MEKSKNGDEDESGSSRQDTKCSRESAGWARTEKELGPAVVKMIVPPQQPAPISREQPSSVPQQPDRRDLRRMWMRLARTLTAQFRLWKKYTAITIATDGVSMKTMVPRSSRAFSRSVTGLWSRPESRSGMGSVWQSVIWSPLAMSLVPFKSSVGFSCVMPFVTGCMG